MNRNFRPNRIFAAFLGVLLCPCLAGCVGSVELSKNTFTTELGSDVYGNPAVYIEHPETVNTSRIEVVALTPGVAKKDNRFVTTGTEYLAVGEYDFSLEYGQTSLPFKIKVKDTKPPVAANSQDTLEVPFGSPIDWAGFFQASDLSGVYYEADRDVNLSVGESDVTVRIYDRFGNSTEKTVHLVVTP